MRVKALTLRVLIGASKIIIRSHTKAAHQNTERVSERRLRFKSAFPTVHGDSPSDFPVSKKTPTIFVPGCATTASGGGEGPSKPELAHALIGRHQLSEATTRNQPMPLLEITLTNICADAYQRVRLLLHLAMFPAK
jgi:hypothetical protein